MEYQEQELVPFTPAALRGERLLVIAPHPDDEAIGCGGLIALHGSEGRSVRVLVVTDGAEGSADPATRENETIAGLQAAKRLGARAVDLRLDAELVVRQLEGRYRVRKPELQPMFERLLALSRQFGWGARGRLDLRVEVFNLFNRANFGPPSLIAFSGLADDEEPLPSFGQIRSTVTSARQVQLGIRVTF